MPNRNKSLYELSIQSAAAGTNDAVKAALEITEAPDLTSDVASISASQLVANANIISISGVNSTQTADIISISGVNSIQTTQIATISGGLTTLSGDMVTLSGNTEIDIYNLDLSQTVALYTLFNNTSTTATSGSYSLPAGPAGFITISISGSSFKLPYYNT